MREHLEAYDCSMIVFPQAPAPATDTLGSLSDTITLSRAAEYSWKCACGALFSDPSENRVRASQMLHRGLHRLQVRAIIAGDTCFAHRAMHPEPTEGWVPGYNCCPATPTAKSERLQQELWKLYSEVLDLLHQG